MENPQFWWYLPGKMVIFMGYVSLPEGKESIHERRIWENGPTHPTATKPPPLPSRCKRAWRGSTASLPGVIRIRSLVVNEPIGVVNPKIGGWFYPQNGGWKSWKTLLKWMISGKTLLIFGNTQIILGGPIRVKNFTPVAHQKLLVLAIYTGPITPFITGRDCA